MPTSYKWTLRFTMLTPILVLLCVFLMGGGHGWYSPTIAIFPWATLNIAWQDHLSEPFLIAGVFQFIVYGIAIDKMKSKSGRRMINASILLLHMVVAAIIFVLKDPHWR